MAELALLASLGYAGYTSEKESKNVNNKSLYDDKILLDDYRYSQYHSNIETKVDDKIKEIYNKRNQDTMDPKKFMIPVYYGLEDKAREIGTGADIIKASNKESFESQFEPQRFDSRKTVALNDIDNSNVSKGSARQNYIASKNKWSVFEDFNEISDVKSNMTYGIVSPSDESFTHNNMNIFNRMKDLPTPELRDHRQLEFFSGSSATYKSKKETEPFFQPVTGNTWGQGGMPSVTAFIESRLIDNVGMEKKKQKPFEPRKVGPGLGLGANQDSLGGVHDTTRILPPTIDELRRKDDQRLTYTAPILAGKKGENRSVVAPFEHRRPDKFRQNVEQVKSGGQVKAQKTSDNINIELGNRTFSMPVMGPAGASNSRFTTPGMKGQVQAPKEKQFKEFNQGPAEGNKTFLQNTESFQILDSQRNSTNVEFNGNISNVKRTTTFNPNDAPNSTQQLNGFQQQGPNNVGQGAYIFNPNDIANPTQQLNGFQQQAPNNVGQGAYIFNPYDTAKTTQQLNGFQQQAPNNVGQGQNLYNPNDLAKATQALQGYQQQAPNNVGQGPNLYNPNDTAKITQQLNGFQQQAPNNVGQGPNYYNPNDMAKATQALQGYQQQGASSNQGQNYYNSNDIAKTTQQLQGYQQQAPNNVGQGPNYYNPNDMAKATQALQGYQQQGAGNSQGIKYFDPNHLANQTQKQDLMTRQFNTFISGNKTHTSELQDNMKQTQQQDLMTRPLNTFIGTNKTHTSELQDEIKQTQKQDLVQKTNMGYLGTHQDSGYTVTDARAPITLKQLINFNNHVNSVGNQTISRSNAFDATNWDAKLTLKDMVKYQDYIGSLGNSHGTVNNMQFENAHTNLTKEILTAGREPTNSNISMIPQIQSLGQVELKEQINIDRLNPPRQTNFNAARPEINQMNKTNISYGDNINLSQMDTLKTNPYYVNGINQMYHYVNNPEYRNATSHQQLPIMPPNQSICSVQDHSQ